jgi:CBS domain-containing protein
MSTEPVSRLKLRPALRVRPSTTLRETIEVMRAGRLGCAIVVDDNDRPVGVFTEAMLRVLMANSALPLGDPVSSHLAKRFAWVKESDPIETVLDGMEAKNVRFVVVVNRSGKLVGLTGQKGLMEYVAEHFPGEVMVQRVGTETCPGHREGA